MITPDGLIERLCPKTRAVSRTVILILAIPVLPACAPICETVNNWTWGTCYSGIHGTDALAVHSELDAPPAAAHANAVEQARILVKRLVREQNLPGLSVAVGQGGAIDWAEGFGWADLDSARPVTPRTRFRIGGAAIPMTAAAVGLLIERGALDIDRPARSYVPAFPEKPWPVSTRQLMAHVAGIRHRDDEAMLYERRACTSPLEAIRIYADNRLRFEPGTAFRYSSYGWNARGRRRRSGGRRAVSRAHAARGLRRAGNERHPGRRSVPPRAGHDDVLLAVRGDRYDHGHRIRPQPERHLHAGRGGPAVDAIRPGPFRHGHERWAVARARNARAAPNTGAARERRADRAWSWLVGAGADARACQRPGGRFRSRCDRGG